MNAHITFEAIKSFSCRACNMTIITIMCSPHKRSSHSVCATFSMKIIGEIFPTQNETIIIIFMRMQSELVATGHPNIVYFFHFSPHRFVYGWYFSACRCPNASSISIKSTNKCFSRWRKKLQSFFFLNILFMSFPDCCCFCLQVQRQRLRTRIGKKQTLLNVCDSIECRHFDCQSIWLINIRWIYYYRKFEIRNKSFAIEENI